jgi:hypothetical protein
MESAYKNSSSHFPVLDSQFVFMFGAGFGVLKPNTNGGTEHMEA